MMKERNVSVVQGLEGNRIVVVNDILFKGKRAVNWEAVETYLKQFIGEKYTALEFGDVIYIDTDFPDEYSHSMYTNILRGANAKAKANAAQGIPEMIETASKKQYTENYKEKHNRNAKFGWYRYESRFALPVFDEEGVAERYNVFRAVIVVRHDRDGKMYLYDMMNIKKETSTLFRSEDLTQ